MFSFGNYGLNVLLCLVTCLFVCNRSYAIVPYLVDTREWGLHMLINNIDIDLIYYLHTGVMRD